MDIFRFGWWLLFPFVCQTLPSNVEERERELTRVAQKRHVFPVEEKLHAIQHVIIPDDRDFQGSVCGAKVGTSWGNLETHGLLREYETGFLNAIKQEPWEHQALFGVCPEDNPSANMVAMKELANFLTKPQGKQFVFLHLQKVEWETGASLQFQGSVQEHISPLLQHLHLLLAVFYPDTHTFTMGSKVIMSGEAVPQGQVVCTSLETRYLVVRLSGTVRTIEPGDLRFHASFHIKHYSDGLALSTAEAAWHLFGMDTKCFTKITPVLIMVVGHSVQPGVYLPILKPDQTNSASSVQDSQIMVTFKKKDEFLETLSHLSTLLMTSHAKTSSTVHLPLDPNDENAGDLRPQLLNVTELEALEWLVESQEPLVFLFLPGSKNLLANRIQGRLNGTLLQRITEKTQEVLEDMKEIFSTGDHAQVLKNLLSSCQGNFNVSYLPVEEDSPQLGDKQHRKLHSLMLLKTLQTIRAYWQDRKKLSRQNRGAGLKPHCRLQELTINLKPYAEYKDIHFPEEININNCVGPCRFPQTTQNEYQAHVILLIQLQERRQSGLDRPPCCVPVQYQEQWLMVAHENGIKLHLYPNMVAKECGCR
ncbi:muellerian-inhibiting factor [Mixophyes fleayi]|uniref:muellerian-inhibiting factor n=1 Tax=Mixophyes fleayi TaxID=3061075 RepID=UPI003F4E111C